MGRRKTKTTRSGSGATSDRKMAATNGRSGYNEQFNQLGASSGSNKGIPQDLDSSTLRTMPSESGNSEYVRKATNTTDVSKIDPLNKKSTTKPPVHPQPLKSLDQSLRMKKPFNQLGARSESGNSEYVCKATNSTTDVSKIDNSSNFPPNKKSTTKTPVHPQPLKSSDQSLCMKKPFNQLGARSESGTSEYVRKATNSTTDVSKIDNSSNFPPNKKSTTKPPVHPQPLKSSDQSMRLKKPFNQLDASSSSNKGILQDLDSSKLRTMPRESGHSEYVRKGTNSTTDVSKIDNSSNFPPNKKSTTKPPVDPQPLESSDQLNYGYRSADQFQALEKFSSCGINNQHGYCAPHTRLNYRPTKMWKVKDGSNMKEKCNIDGEVEARINIDGEVEAMIDLTRGPLGQREKSVSDLSDVNKWLWLSVRRDLYNLEDFQTKYDNAKFYIIKSVGEDDIHKSIKYNVWSSTPYGNRKLDAAFRETQDETSEADTVCPIFLFYSVNRSGRFVGVAEMIGKVDFAKNLDFWQNEKGKGFFPVMWHIIKDIPNTQLTHIIIESNVKTPVTDARDMQEIGLQQGLEMLRIFKNYTAMKSILDNFNFYEKRERLLREESNKRASNKNRVTQEQEKKHQQALPQSRKPNPAKPKNSIPVTYVEE